MILGDHSSTGVLGDKGVIVKFWFDGGVVLGDHRGTGVLGGKGPIVRFCFDGGVVLGGP